MEVIRVENINKKYRLGVYGGKTFSEDLAAWWSRKRGKSNPLIQIGDEKRANAKGEFWALRDINFSVNRGEVLGVIGKNGAGKSTLLKLLSRITAPSGGEIKIRGRIASLLEVGTGFHPDLTGRENIFLNGAILGMTRVEVASRLDEIIHFSGIEHHIDTPVKRYSSGMKVRLGFAVAAHLEPEILIVDEVLAVGDAEFQRKCVGKMQDVAGHGRTVLFVSHQLGMVKTLCPRSILLEEGKLVYDNDTELVIDKYLETSTSEAQQPVVNFHEDLNSPVQVSKAVLCNAFGTPNLQYDVFEQVMLEIEYVVREDIQSVSCIIDVERNGEMLFTSFDTDNSPELLVNRKAGKYRVQIPLLSPLKAGNYQISLRISRTNVGPVFSARHIFNFRVEERSFDPSLKSYAMKRVGVVPANIVWESMKPEAI